MEYTELFQAVKKNDIDTVKKFLNSDFDIAQKDNQIFIIAGYNGYLDIVKLLIEDDRIDPNARNSTALINIINQGNQELIEFVINHDKVDFKNLEPKILNSILLMASLNDNTKLINKILSIDFKIDHKKDILYQAIEQNRLNSVKALLKDERFNEEKILTHNICIFLSNFGYDEHEILSLKMFKAFFENNTIDISSDNGKRIIQYFIKYYAYNVKENYIEIFKFLISLPKFDIKSVLQYLFSISNTRLLEFIYNEKKINFLETNHFLISFNEKVFSNIEYLLTLSEFSFIKEDAIELFSHNKEYLNISKKYNINISPVLFYLFKYKKIQKHLIEFVRNNYSENTYYVLEQYIFKEKIKSF